MIQFTNKTEKERTAKGHCKGCFGCRVPCGKATKKEKIGE